MCTTCGCSADEVRIGHANGHDHGHDHHHGPGHVHGHSHGHDHAHDHSHEHGHSHPALPGKSTRLIQVERDLLDENNRLARDNREFFQRHGILALNLVSSPGSGKTTLLVRSLELLRGRVPLAVIEGDQETDNDAARVRATGVPAIQVNTGKGCHLDALMISRCFDRMTVPRGGVLFIENVGNLVCPAGFDLGEAHKVVVASVTEGEDKPLKYPNMFAAADLLLVSKCDLLPHLRFDVDALEANARRVNPRIQVIRVSAETGIGLADWVSWIEHERATLRGVLLTDTVRGASATAMTRSAPG